MNMQVCNLLKKSENTYDIARDRVIRLRYHIRDAVNGGLLQFGDDLFYLHGGYGGAFPKVERAMEGRRVGDTVSVDLGPDEGYGRHDAGRVLKVPSTDFEDAVPELGEAVEGELPDGRSMTFFVAGIADGQITLDGNHPFAGKQLQCDFEVLEVRDSIEAERAAGFAFDGLFN